MARHGQSEWQAYGDSAGPDAPLTQLGELQAHRLGEYVAKTYQVKALYASDLSRAYRTAEIVADYLDMPVQREVALREFDEWDIGWAPQPASKWDPGPGTPNLTPSYDRFVTRLRTALRGMVDGYEGDETILIIAHGGTIGTIWRIALGSHTPRLSTWNAALHELEWRKSSWGLNWVIHRNNILDYLPGAMRTS